MLQKLSWIDELTFFPRLISKFICFHPCYSSNSSFIRSNESIKTE